MFFKIGVLKSIANFIRIHLCWSLFLRPKACNFIKKRLQHSCFPVKVTKFLRTPTNGFYINNIITNVPQKLPAIKCNGINMKQIWHQYVTLVTFIPTTHNTKFQISGSVTLFSFQSLFHICYFCFK